MVRHRVGADRATLAGHDLANREFGVVDQRVEAW